jgi:hypothetical protein
MSKLASSSNYMQNEGRNDAATGIAANATKVDLLRMAGKRE